MRNIKLRVKLGALMVIFLSASLTGCDLSKDNIEAPGNSSTPPISATK